MKKRFHAEREAVPTERGSNPPASQAMVDFAAENWKLQQTVERCLPGMDPMDAERFMNHFEWYQRKTWEMLDEAGICIVDLTGREYNTGMAVSPLNLEDFPNRHDTVFRIAQMVEPIVMEKGQVRKAGTVMLTEEMDGI